MIQDRPTRMRDFGERVLLPSTPFSISWEMVPEFVRLSLMPVFGIQPVTAAMFEAAGQQALGHVPTEGEIAYFRESGTQFQMVQVVFSLAWWDSVDQGVEAVPFSISILPASKRGKVTSIGCSRRHTTGLSFGKHGIGLELRPSRVSKPLKRPGPNSQVLWP
ncbi:hypothetical protein [Pseudorhizobium marinum]|uniref:hypothetical protein n=1 Tax=Pseudorhizobium marinum TaxID=1496690 RepID=UPI000497186E|nr:hypothetical protein [Pseudorhizobium marinum]